MTFSVNTASASSTNLVISSNQQTTGTNTIYLPSVNGTDYFSSQAQNNTWNGVCQFANTTNSTSTGSGALTFLGGFGVAKDIWCGGYIYPTANWCSLVSGNGSQTTNAVDNSTGIASNTKFLVYLGGSSTNPNSWTISNSSANTYFITIPKTGVYTIEGLIYWSTTTATAQQLFLQYQTSGTPNLGSDQIICSQNSVSTGSSGFLQIHFTKRLGANTNLYLACTLTGASGFSLSGGAAYQDSYLNVTYLGN